LDEDNSLRRRHYHHHHHHHLAPYLPSPPTLYRNANKGCYDSAHPHHQPGARFTMLIYIMHWPNQTIPQYFHTSQPLIQNALGNHFQFICHIRRSDKIRQTGCNVHNCSACRLHAKRSEGGPWTSTTSVFPHTQTNLSDVTSGWVYSLKISNLLNESTQLSDLSRLFF
jgi:hypothetical protein